MDQDSITLFNTIAAPFAAFKSADRYADPDGHQCVDIAYSILGIGKDHCVVVRGFTNIAVAVEECACAAVEQARHRINKARQSSAAV